MGACFISKALSIKLTPKDIEGWFRAVSVGGGDSEGYSGSWDTLRGVSFPDVPVFDTKEAAREYISDHAGKWSSALCVRYAQRVVRDVFVTVPTIGGVPVVHRGTIVSAVTDWKVPV